MLYNMGMNTTPQQRENLIALLMRQGNDRPTACIILDAREAAAKRNGRDRFLAHAYKVGFQAPRS